MQLGYNNVEDQQNLEAIMGLIMFGGNAKTMQWKRLRLLKSVILS